MLKIGLGSRVPVRSLLLFAVAILAPALARADDFGWAGDSSCSDPPIFSDIFSLPATNASGGLCRAFGNHTGHNLTSLSFTAPYQTTNPDFFCATGTSTVAYFQNCDFNVDGTIYHTGDTPPSFRSPDGHTITVEFFGTNSDHQGIPVDTTTGCTDTSTDPACFNFYINLNSRICSPLSSTCVLVQPTGGPNGNGTAGDWGANVVIGGVANAPEPRTGVFVLTALGVLLARMRAVRNRHATN
jgi:hypothetical protein